MRKFTVAILVSLCCFSSLTAQSAVPDSLNIQQAVALTILSHPAIRQAEFAKNASSARIDASNSARYPEISLDGGYERIGPVPQFNLPGEGGLELAPYNNYDVHLGLRQTLYDFGKTDASVRVANASSQTAADNIELAKFRLSYQTINVFNNILILHQRIEVLNQQLQTLGQHLDLSVKMIKAGTATEFDTLTIQVRIAVVRSDRIDALRMVENQEILFRQLTGLAADSPVALKGGFASEKIAYSPDSLTSVALKQRPELLLARDAEKSAEAQSHLVSLGDKPLLALNVVTGLKNGYEPNLNTWRGNYAAGLDLRIPLLNGHRTRYQLAEAGENFKSSQSHTTDLEHQILAEVRQATTDINSSLEKIASTETQVRQAEEAVTMARARYNAGVITNLDLLDAETTLSQTQLIRLRALYDYTVSLYDLDRATGKNIGRQFNNALNSNHLRQAV